MINYNMSAYNMKLSTLPMITYVEYPVISCDDYHILLVNSRGYYKFQVKIGVEIVILKLCIRYKFMVFNLVRGDYLNRGY